MQYGIPYKGSKSKIAEWVVRNLPASHTLVDLFAGGCAVTHCALLSGKYERIIANDLNGTPELFRECVMGEMDGYSTVSSRSEFADARTTDPAIAVLYSFGNGLTSYLWSQEIEPAKTVAARMLSAPSLHERRINYRKFIKAVSEYLSDKDAQTALVGGEVTDCKIWKVWKGWKGCKGWKGWKGWSVLGRITGLSKCLMEPRFTPIYPIDNLEGSSTDQSLITMRLRNGWQRFRFRSTSANTLRLMDVLRLIVKHTQQALVQRRIINQPQRDCLFKSDLRRKASDE